eukprot:508878-Lingulodinium_polyedra.AAC.1
MPWYPPQALPGPGLGVRDPQALQEAQGARRGPHFKEPGFADHHGQAPGSVLARGPAQERLVRAISAAQDAAVMFACQAVDADSDQSARAL